MPKKAGKILWRIIENGKSTWKVLSSEERVPFGAWRVVAVKYRGKWHSSLLDDIYGYGTIDMDNTEKGLPIICPVCNTLACNGCNGTELRYPVPPETALAAQEHARVANCGNFDCRKINALIR